MQGNFSDANVRLSVKKFFYLKKVTKIYPLGNDIEENLACHVNILRHRPLHVPYINEVERQSEVKKVYRAVSKTCKYDPSAHQSPKFKVK